MAVSFGTSFTLTTSMASGDPVVEQLGRMAARLQSTQKRALMNELGTFIYSISQDSFKREADPVTGAKWPPISERWLKYKKKKGKSTRILVFRAKLINSGAVMSQTNFAKVVYRTNYASDHQEGRSGGKGGKFSGILPQRRFLGLNEQDKGEMARMIERRFQQAAGA